LELQDEKCSSQIVATNTSTPIIGHNGVLALSGERSFDTKTMCLNIIT